MFDLVVRNKVTGKESLRMGCGCIFVILVMLFFAVYGVFKFFGV